MKFLAILAIVLAYGPALFDLAVTGRGVNRPTRTSTTDWALTQFSMLHMGKPSLAIPPTGLPVGAVLTESDQNNQDSAVQIWTIYRVTTRRALANVVTNFNGRRLDRQWRYIRGWWRHDSGRVIDQVLIVFYSLPFIAVLLTIWRKRVLCQRRLGTKRSATLAHPSPILANFVAIRSLVRTDTIQPTQRTEQAILTIAGAPTRLLGQLPRHLAFNLRSHLVISTPTRNVARSIPQRIIVIALLVLPRGFVIIHYEAVDDLAFWTVTVVFNPGARSSSAVSRRADDINRVPQRTLTLPTPGLIEAGTPQSDVISTCSSTPRRPLRSNSLGLSRALLPPRIVRQGGEPLPSHERVAPAIISPKRRPGSTSSSFITIHSVEGVLVMACCSTGNGLHWSIQFYPFQHYHISLQTGNDNDEEESIQATASGIEHEAQVVLAPSVNSDDGYEGDEAEEEETGGNDLVEPALVSLPPSRHASPEAEEELLRADFLPLDDSRPNSPERHALDRSTRRSDLHQYISALSHHYINLRAMLVRPLLPGEVRAMRADVRPRLGSLGERARERRGLPPSTSVATELQGQANEEHVVEQVVEQVYEEEVAGPVHEEEIGGQVHEEEADGHVDEAVDGQFNEGEVEVSRKRKRPHRGGKKTRPRKHRHQTDKEEEADPTRED